MTREASAADKRPGPLRDLVGDQALTSPTTRIFVDDAGAASGFAVFLDPGAGRSEPILGLVSALSGAGKRTYAVIAHGVHTLIAAGHTHGSFTISDPLFLQLLKSTFRITPVPCGWEPNTGVPVQWTVRVDLADALDQLTNAAR